MWFCDDFWEKRSWLICLNSLNTRSKVRRRSLILIRSFESAYHMSFLQKQNYSTFATNIYSSNAFQKLISQFTNPSCSSDDLTIYLLKLSEKNSKIYYQFKKQGFRLFHLWRMTLIKSDMKMFSRKGP